LLIAYLLKIINKLMDWCICV